MTNKKSGIAAAAAVLLSSAIVPDGSGFVSIALAIKVQEGVALMLDDKAQIIGIANPIIMKAEAKRMNQGGFERILRIAKDTFRDVKVRWERESDARRLAAQGTAENSR